MIIDWSLPFKLETPDGDLYFNSADGTGPFLVADACVAQYQVRSSKDNIPQSDGSILHRKFKTGYEIGLTLELYKTDTVVACGDDVTVMGDEIDGLLSSLLNPPDQLGRLIWTPSGGTARMFNEVALAQAPIAQQPENAPIRVTFALETQFPYAIEQTEQDENVGLGTEIINVTGNTPTWPVARVNGGAGGIANFFLANNTLELELAYDGAIIPPGEYLEINMFNNTAFLNGDGANRINAFDPEVSDFWPFVAGDNEIFFSATDGSVDFLINGAWA